MTGHGFYDLSGEAQRNALVHVATRLACRLDVAAALDFERQLEQHAEHAAELAAFRWLRADA